MDTARSNTGRSSDRAWKAVLADWESLQAPRNEPHALTGSDINRISHLTELDKRVKTAVSTVKSARQSLFEFRESAARKADLEHPQEINGKRIISIEKPRPLLSRLLSIFETVAFNVSNVRRAYNQAVPENIRPLVDKFGGKSFTRNTNTPSALLLASVPKGKEGKDLSISTLMKGIDGLVERLSDPVARAALRMKHDIRVIRNENHVVLYRQVDGVEQSIEMSFRRANKVDIFINGKPTPSGSLYNDDALKTAEAFLKGKNMNFKGGVGQTQRFKEYVVVKDVASLRAP